MMSRIAGHAALSFAFRPMFLGLGIYAVVAVAMWIAALGGALPVHRAYGPLWHAHEMLFGFALAAVAGFLLTAVATWTGRPPVQGVSLLVLAGAWLLGRVAMAIGHPPAMWSAGIAMVFPVLLTVLVAREIWRGGSRRNYPIAAIVALLAMLDGHYHLSTLGMVMASARLTLLAALYVLLLLVTVIAGRIIPSFTGNWLRARHIERHPVTITWVERLTAPLTGVTGALALTLPAHPLTGAAAAVTCVLHALRLSRWRGLATRHEPLLFILHVAYAWLPVGFGLLAISILSDAIPLSSAIHAFGVGAIGTMILAVTTRVALGHTGRPLRAPTLAVLAYVALTLAAIARIAAPETGSHYLIAVEIAAFAWIMAWSLFLLAYTPMLLRPRADAGQ